MALYTPNPWQIDRKICAKYSAEEPKPPGGARRFDPILGLSMNCMAV
jgi:hypothetical protein